ncbi:putative T6SS immunity periplasmic lipoprotein [Serratia marcescens]|uniref:putative T6SS immunity periplasmic lipoprotein n=1 Tax=Serratia marcescens TaxID=615 RepID=UPI000AE8B975|nr:putative T6SS immunity periplasmic lipoprotein [Serratia marcescens]
MATTQGNARKLTAGEHRFYLSLLCALLLNGCQSTPPWYHPLDVSLKDNQPCFAVPINSVRSGDSLQNRGMIVSRQEQQQWHIVWTSPEVTPLPDLKPGQCVTYSQVNWAEGEYSVLLGVSMNNDTERRKYMRTFTLSIEHNGKTLLRSDH